MVEKHHRYSTIADATIYSARGFLNALADHEHSALECVYLEGSHSHNFTPDVKINLSTLRRSFSSRAARSFCKTEKKLSVLNDMDVKAAKKSLFHSLRILMYGIQIATEGKITNYQCANDYWWKIYGNISTEWYDYKKEYEPIYKNLKKQFKSVAPLD